MRGWRVRCASLFALVSAETASTTIQLMRSFTFGSGPAIVRIPRVLIVAAGFGSFAIAIYRAPVWLETWGTVAVVAAVAAATALLVIAIGVGTRGSARAVKRVAAEIFFLGCSLILAEGILLARSPESWSDDPRVQRTVARMHAAADQGIAYDGRLRFEVVRDLQSKGLDAVPGVAQIVGLNPVMANAIRERGLLPLSNASNAYVVECNEGLGYFQFHSDELGFNNPPGLVSGRVDIAIIGESLALGHCVPPSKSAADRVRAQYPQTANFGVAGSRVLAHLGIFREYVESLKPAVVVWFVNSGYAEPGDERYQPLLMNYFNDPLFSQRLRQRQSEVDAFVRDIVVPLDIEEETTFRDELARSNRLPLKPLITLREVRRLVDFGPHGGDSSPPVDLSHFERALDVMADSAREWGGRLVVVILPNYQISTAQPRSVARYQAVRQVLDAHAASVVDGVALFDAHPDPLSLYTLRSDNHPSERGHALLGDAVIAAIQREGAL